MNDSIDLNVYSDLHARVNDNNYGITNSLEKLDSSRDQKIVLLGYSRNKDASPLIKTCQQCGIIEMNKKECKTKKHCNSCDWPVMKNGFPSAAELDPIYPINNINDVDNIDIDNIDVDNIDVDNIDVDTVSIDTLSSEIVPGYTSQIDYMNQLAHKHRTKTPDITIALHNSKDLFDDERNTIERFNDSDYYVGITFWSAVYISAIALLVFRLSSISPRMTAGQIIIEMCLALYFPIIYFIYIGAITCAYMNNMSDNI